MQKKKKYIFSLLRNFFRQKNHCFKKKAWAFFAPFLYTVFGFFLFLFNRLFPERNQEKECTAEKFISFLSFSFFFLPPPFFVFFFPSHFLLKLLWLFFFFYPFPEVISQESCFLVLSVGEELSLLSMWHRGRRRLGLLFDPMGAVVSPIISPKTNLIWIHAHQMHSWTASIV